MTNRTNPRSSAALLGSALAGAIAAAAIWTNAAWQGNGTRPAPAGIDVSALSAAANAAKLPLLVVDNPI
jgi:hypothetical protein